MQYRYLLIGGTGAIGYYLKEEVKENNAVVYVTSRRPRESSDGVHYLCGDAHNFDFLKRILLEVKPDVIIDFMVYSTIEFQARYELLLNSARQYIFLSSYRVFDNNRPLKESSPRILDVCDDAEYLKTDEYALAKARQEDILRGAKYNNWTIVRPSITYSKNRFQFGCLEAGVVCFRALNNLPVVIPEEMLDKHTTMTWAKDVACMISKLALNPGAMGEDFNVVTSESPTWRDILDIYHSAIGMKVNIVSMEDYLTICATHQTKYDRMFDREMDNSKILRITGMRQSDLTPITIGLTRELELFKKNPFYQYGVDIGASAKMDRLCQTRTPLTGFPMRQRLTYYRCRYEVVGRTFKMLAKLKFKKK